MYKSSDYEKIVFKQNCLEFAIKSLGCTDSKSVLRAAKDYYEFIMDEKNNDSQQN